MVLTGYVLTAVIGLVLGSFATALIYRIPRGIPWSGSSRSACTHCKAVLGPGDLVPLFSWLRTGGKCRHCGISIGLRYPLTELTVLAACLAAYAAHGFTAPGLLLMAATPFLVALLVIDLEELILPNQLVAMVGGLGLLRIGVLAWQGVDISGLALEYGLGALLYALGVWGLGWLMQRVLKKEALGFGDVKFFAVAGLWLGLSRLPWFCMAGGFLGVIFALLWQAIKKEKVFPFGPALIASFYILLLADGSLLP